MFEQNLDYLIETRKCCNFYIGIYKKMRSWFGNSSNYWLCDMPEPLLLKNILRMNIKPSMITLYLNISIKIRRNNKREYALLETYRNTHKDYSKCLHRKEYYKNNILKIKKYNETYHILKSLRINIFKKNSS